MGFQNAEAAEAAFYDAFRRGDPTAMRAVWSNAGDVVCVHPMGPLLSGSTAVIASWDEILSAANGASLEVELRTRLASETLETRVVVEIFSAPGADYRFAPIIATNGYRLEPDGWQMILHHASPEPQAARGEEPRPGVLH